MVLIEIHKPDGSLVGRCDAHCYNAKHPECDCICGGINHGKGLNEGAYQTSRYKDIIKNEHMGCIVTQFGVQQDLFGDTEK